jgi:hypothetical protein
MSSIFEVDNVVVGGGSAGSGATCRVSDWTQNTSYSDGAIVVFNGSQYVACGSVPAGLVPPVEYYTPLTPSQPRWQLAARGRSLPQAYSDNPTYYADQMVTHLGGTFILDAPTVPAGTRPGRDKRWTRLSETLTAAEGEQLASVDLTNFAPTVTAAIISNSDEVGRVRHHRVRMTISTVIGPSVLYTCKFPKSISSEARPQITIQTEDQIGFYMLLTAMAVTSGGQVTGYVMAAQAGAPAATLEFTVFVKEQIDQVRVS